MWQADTSLLIFWPPVSHDTGCHFHLLLFSSSYLTRPVPFRTLKGNTYYQRYLIDSTMYRRSIPNPFRRRAGANSEPRNAIENNRSTILMINNNTKLVIASLNFVLLFERLGLLHITICDIQQSLVFWEKGELGSPNSHHCNCSVPSLCHLQGPGILGPSQVT